MARGGGKATWAEAAWAAWLAVALVAGCGSVVEIGPLDAASRPDLSASKLGDGESCGQASDCGSGVCTDSVCCHTACDGICEACNVPGAIGTCSPIPALTDPDQECMPKALTTTDGGSSADGFVLNLPDAGLGQMDAPCVPTCNGQRACEFPDAKVTCGASFCNTPMEVGSAVCDGAGHCGLGFSECTGYVCGNDACKTVCAANSDCQDDFYCSTNNTCLPKKAVATSCLNGGECGSGFCDNNVCCSTDCSLVQSGNCDSTGFVGTCKCTIAGHAACDGTCQLYYSDLDNDGYGDPDTGVLGCSAQADTFTGRILDHSDCGDDDAQVHPGQTFVTTSTWKSTWRPQFDWNCDGSVTQEFAVRTGAVCKFCNPASHFLFQGTCGGGSTMCAKTTDKPYIDCAVSEYQACPAGQTICLASECCGLGCSDPGVFGVNSWAFTSGGTTCGSTGTITWCDGGCSATNGTAQTDIFSDTQGCE